MREGKGTWYISYILVSLSTIIHIAFLFYSKFIQHAYGYFQLFSRAAPNNIIKIVNRFFIFLHLIMCNVIGLDIIYIY